MENLGRIPPSFAKQEQNNRYNLSRWELAPAPMGTVNRILEYPKEFVSWYDQPNNSCTAYSASWICSIHNKKKYNAQWLYCEGCKLDKDPSTSCKADIGGYIWAMMDVLKSEGHCIDKATTPSFAEGIVSYAWGGIDEARTAINSGYPVVFGTDWHNWPIVTKNGERWISDTNWGGVLGGHAYCVIGALDSRISPAGYEGGFLILNTWGPSWPPTLISYTSMTKLLNARGECCIPMDRDPILPPPPPPPSDETVTMNGLYKNVKFKGTLNIKAS